MRNYLPICFLIGGCSSGTFEWDGAELATEGGSDAPLTLPDARSETRAPFLDAGEGDSTGPQDAGKEASEMAPDGPPDASPEASQDSPPDGPPEAPDGSEPAPDAPSDGPVDAEEEPDPRNWNCGFAILNQEPHCRCEVEFAVNDADECIASFYACCMKEADDICRCGGPLFCSNSPGIPVSGCP